MSEDQTYQGQPLTDNLGTNRNIRMTGEIDMRKFTNIDDPDIVFLMYARIRSKKSPTWALIYDEVLNMKVGVGGLGLRYAVRGEQVRKGIAANPDAEMPQRPGWAARHNPFDREAKEQEERFQNWKKETQLE